MRSKIHTKALVLGLCLTLGLETAGCASNTKISETAQVTTKTITETSAEPIQSGADTAHPYVFEDVLGYEVTVTNHERVVALYGSFAGTWLNAGGTIIGTTQDAVEERRLGESMNPTIVGTVKEPDMETIISLNPDFIILSANIESHVKLHESLTDMGISHAYFETETVNDYLAMLKICTEITGDAAAYEANGLAVKAEIEAVKAKAETILKTEKIPTVLLLRAFSTGAKAKTDDVIAGAILKDLGADNIAARVPSLLEELSLEEIITQDPDYIFVVVMGSDEQKALDALKVSLTDNPAWAQLTAVKSDHYIVLPKDLFHYKPNERWGESYEYLAKILYPEIQ